MSTDIHLTKQQVLFVIRMTEIINQDDAVDRMIELMIEERLDASHIVAVIDRGIKKLLEKK